MSDFRPSNSSFTEESDFFTEELHRRFQGFVMPTLRKRWGRYRKKDVNLAFQEISAQVENLHGKITEDVLNVLATMITNAQQEVARIHEIANKEISMMRETLQKERDNLTQERATLLEAARQESELILQKANQENTRVNAQKNELTMFLEKITSIFKSGGPLNS